MDLNPTTEAEEREHIRLNRLGELCGMRGRPTLKQSCLIDAEMRAWKPVNKVAERFKRMRMEIE